MIIWYAQASRRDSLNAEKHVSILLPETPCTAAQYPMPAVAVMIVKR
jgi:hypothetical protein